MRAAKEQGYLELERLFRGTEEEIEERISTYGELLQGRGEVLDLGCGRGEALDGLAVNEARYRIVDLRIHDGNAPAPAHAEMMMAAPALRAAAAPARIEAGTQRLSVVVSGEIELSID